MEDENQHLDSDSNSSSSDGDTSAAEAREPVYYSDYEDYKNAEWSSYAYCSESSEDESGLQAATSKSDEAEQNLPRLFGYSPSLFCRFGGKVMCVPETPEESYKWKTTGKCQSCQGPTHPHFEKCNSRCFENRADVSHNRLGPFIFCSFRQRNREPR